MFVSWDNFSNLKCVTRTHKLSNLEMFICDVDLYLRRGKVV